MFRGTNVHYEVADRIRAFGQGGIGLFHQLANRVGLTRRINDGLHLLKVHKPYHESDHVLNFAFNPLCGGTCLEDIELRRNDEAFMDALGAQRIPDPTTAGDFCRRFQAWQVEDLMRLTNESRLDVWKHQPDEFFDEAVIDADGTLVPTSGECKEGMDISFKGRLGLPPAACVAAEHRRAALSREPLGQSSFTRGCSRLAGRGGRPLPARRFSRDHVAR